MKKEFQALIGTALVIFLGAVGLIFLTPEEFWPSFTGNLVQAISGAGFVTLVVFFLYAYGLLYAALAFGSRFIPKLRYLVIAVPSFAYLCFVYWTRFGELGFKSALIALVTFCGVALVQLAVFSRPVS